MRDRDGVRALLDGHANSLATIPTESGGSTGDRTRALIHKSPEGDCNVIMLTWGDSLSSFLTDEEVAELHRVVDEHVDGRALTLACDNQWGLNKAAELGRYVRGLGLDLYMVRPVRPRSPLCIHQVQCTHARSAFSKCSSTARASPLDVTTRTRPPSRLRRSSFA